MESWSRCVATVNRLGLSVDRIVWKYKYSEHADTVCKISVGDSVVENPLQTVETHMRWKSDSFVASAVGAVWIGHNWSGDRMRWSPVRHIGSASGISTDISTCLSQRLPYLAEQTRNFCLFWGISDIHVDRVFGHKVARGVFCKSRGVRYDTTRYKIFIVLWRADCNDRGTKAMNGNIWRNKDWITEAANLIFFDHEGKQFWGRNRSLMCPSDTDSGVAMEWAGWAPSAGAPGFQAKTIKIFPQLQLKVGHLDIKH